jgi:hypothetical protein
VIFYPWLWVYTSNESELFTLQLIIYFSFSQNMQFENPISSSHTTSNARLNDFEYSAWYGIPYGSDEIFSGMLSEPIYIVEYEY